MAPKKSPVKAPKPSAPAMDLNAEIQKAANGGYYLKVSKKPDGEWSFKHNFITGHTGKWSDSSAQNNKQDATFVYLPDYRLAGSLADIRDFTGQRGISMGKVFDKNSKNDSAFLAEVAAQKARVTEKSTSTTVKTVSLSNLIQMAAAYSEEKATFVKKDTKSPKKSPSKSTVSDSEKFTKHVQETLEKGKWLNISALKANGTGSKAVDGPTEKHSHLDAPFDKVFWSTGARAVKAGNVNEGVSHAKKLLRDGGREVSSPRSPRSPPKAASPKAVSPRVVPVLPVRETSPQRVSPPRVPAFNPVNLPSLPGIAAPKPNPFAAAPMPAFKAPTFRPVK